MILILCSIVTGIIGLNMGGLTNFEAFMYLGGIIGALSPSMYVLERLYKIKCKEIKIQETQILNNLKDS